MRVRWKDFELPNRIGFDEEVATDSHASFVAEPYERGFATTLGNALQKTLYASIEGPAVTAIKIKGVDADTETMKGIVEDVIDVVLNLKQLMVKFDDNEPKTLTIKASKKGVVTAAQIEPVDGVEILNPDLEVCTLAENVKFEVEIMVKKGRRFLAIEDQPKAAGWRLRSASYAHGSS